MKFSWGDATKDFLFKKEKKILAEGQPASHKFPCCLSKQHSFPFVLCTRAEFPNTFLDILLTYIFLGGKRLASGTIL